MMSMIRDLRKAVAEAATPGTGVFTYSPQNNPYIDSKKAAEQLLAARNAKMQPRTFESTGQPEWARGSASWGRYSMPIQQQTQNINQRQNIAQLMATPTSVNQRYLNNPGPSLARTADGRSAQMPRTRAQQLDAIQKMVDQRGYYYPTAEAPLPRPTPPVNPELLPLNPVNISQAQTAQDAQKLMVENRIRAAENRRRILGY